MSGIRGANDKTHNSVQKDFKRQNDRNIGNVMKVKPFKKFSKVKKVKVGG